MAFRRVSCCLIGPGRVNECLILSHSYIELLIQRHSDFPIIILQTILFIHALNTTLGNFCQFFFIEKL